MALHSEGSIEQLMTIPQAASELGVPISTLRRAVNAGMVPTHVIGNSRKRVRLSELFEAIEQKQEG